MLEKNLYVIIPLPFWLYHSKFREKQWGFFFFFFVLFLQNIHENWKIRERTNLFIWEFVFGKAKLENLSLENLQKKELEKWAEFQFIMALELRFLFFSFFSVSKENVVESN